MQCTDDVKTKDALLQRLINIGASFKNIDSLPTVGRTVIESRDKVSLKFFESETKAIYTAAHPLTDYQQLSVEEKLLAVVDHIVQAQCKPVLLVIDELDRVDDTSCLLYTSPSPRD